MKANRLNLIDEVREALVAAGYSSVAVVNAVNAELGKLQSTEEDNKLGEGKSKNKGFIYAINETTTTKYEGKMTMPLLFDAWHSAVKKVQKIAITTVEVPKVFTEWLDKFAKKQAPAPQNQQAPAQA